MMMRQLAMHSVRVISVNSMTAFLSSIIGAAPALGSYLPAKKSAPVPQYWIVISYTCRDRRERTPTGYYGAKDFYER